MPGVYEDIVIIIQDYLGPAGQRFIDRQIIFHLKKKPHEITKKDVPDLVEWVKVTLASITADVNAVQDCSNRISRLASS